MVDGQGKEESGNFFSPTGNNQLEESGNNLFPLPTENTCMLNQTCICMVQSGRIAVERISVWQTLQWQFYMIYIVHYISYGYYIPLHLSNPVLVIEHKFGTEYRVKDFV